MRRSIGYMVALGAATVALAAGCGGGDGGDDAAAPAGDEAPPAAASGGGDGTLTLDGESIALDSVRCFLQPQEAAAGGGQILFTGQGTGQDADGQEVLIDVSRYDEDSMFAGDAVSLTVGDPFSEDSATYEARGEQDAVSLDGSTLTGEGLALTDYQGPERTVSFRLDC